MSPSMHHISLELFTLLRSTIEQGGYWLLFVVSILEGVPLIGSLLPGHTLIAVAGFFAHLGILNVWYVTALAIGGAFMGDIFGYMLGKKYGYDSLVSLGRHFLLKKEHIDRARSLVAKHTGKSILIGRFNPFTRSLMPFIMGSSGVHMRSFWVYDAIGCILWVVSTVIIGYVFGASYVIVAKTFGKIVLFGIILICLLIWGYHFVNTRAHIFRRYELGTLIVILFSVYGFFLTLQDVVTAHSFFANLDVWVNLYMDHYAVVLSPVFRVVSVILSPFFFSCCAIVYALYLLVQRLWSKAFLVVTSMSGGLILNGIIKIIIGRTRPENALVTLSDYSFPSGHALAGAIFFYLCIYFFSRHFKRQLSRDVFIAACCGLIILTGASRVLLNAHWLSDVIAGMTLGLLWTGLMVLLTRFIKRSIAR